MSQQPTVPLGAITPDLSLLAAACRALTLGGVVAALAACAEQAGPTALPESPAVSAAAVNAPSAPTELAADAIDRILPALEKDAAGPVGNALRALDATLRDPSTTPAARERVAAAVQDAVARFADPARGDAADLEAMWLEVDAIPETFE